MLDVYLYTCNTFFYNLLVHVIYSRVSGQHSLAILFYQWHTSLSSLGMSKGDKNTKITMGAHMGKGT